MARFCPYCGKQLGDRSRFCPKCGKAAPERKRIAAVAVDDSDDYSDRSNGGALAAARAREIEPINESSGRRRRVEVVTAPRRIAPPTHFLIGTYEQAGFGLRYGAWMFDFLITMIAMMGFTFGLTAVQHRSVVGSNSDLLIVVLLTLVLFVLNLVVLAGLNGQSAGMRILGIRIVRVDGSEFKMKQAALRHLVGYPLSSLFFFLGFLWMLWDPKQQGWHDKIAKTMVVMTR